MIHQITLILPQAWLWLILWLPQTRQRMVSSYTCNPPPPLSLAESWFFSLPDFTKWIMGESTSFSSSVSLIKRPLAESWYFFTWQIRPWRSPLLLLLLTLHDQVNSGVVLVLLLVQLDKVECGGVLVLLPTRLHKVNHSQVLLQVPEFTKQFMVESWYSYSPELTNRTAAESWLFSYPHWHDRTNCCVVLVLLFAKVERGSSPCSTSQSESWQSPGPSPVQST